MPPTTIDLGDDRIARLIERRRKIVELRKSITDTVEAEQREDLDEDEDKAFREYTRQVKSVDERIADLSEEARRMREIEQSTAAMRRGIGGAHVGFEARTYEKNNGRSYLQDLARTMLGHGDVHSARDRLERHAQEVAVTEHRDLSRAEGSGGFFVPPTWLLNEYAEFARAGRATANVVTNEALPPGTDSINIPRITTGTAVEPQTADLAEIQETNLVDDVVTAPVRTIAGQQDIAMQLLDQSPISFDNVVLRDLTADLAVKVDVQVIGGSGLNGQALGIRGTSGIITVAFTDATPTVIELYAVLADAVQRVHTQRFMPPQVIVMHPRRWAWFLAAKDTSGRPLVLPQANAPQNAAGILSAVASDQVVGQMHGLPVVTDANIPITVNTTRDVILIMRGSDHFLWESGIRTRVSPTPPPGVAAGSPAPPSVLGVRFELWEYMAFTAGRFPKSTVEISGTGLTTPNFTTA